ncbi:hypothetical protein OG394_05705 [Kribbella sp. NBC_01245]|uniref:hypothetical protein n=1 Tax=Kribbella sp. NBC_01245 TaxID=2903578 RepID=UPI002E2A5BC8|nr:hypothetical protein [Kribbella sp. NBC_01245]
MRWKSLFVVAGLVGSALVVSAPMAQAATTNAAAPAAGRCSLVPPTRLVISAPYRAVTLRVGSDCVAGGWDNAGWTSYHPTRGVQEVAYFFRTSTTMVMDLYDYADLGRWTWRPNGAYDTNNLPMTQNSPYSDVKVGSWAGLTASRSGSKVTLNVSAARYATSLNKFIPYTAAIGQLQYKAPGATTWIALKSVKTTSTGKYTYAYTSAAARDYRVYFPATGLIWNAASTTIRK